MQAGRRFSFTLKRPRRIAKTMHDVLLSFHGPKGNFDKIGVSLIRGSSWRACRQWTANKEVKNVHIFVYVSGSGEGVPRVRHC